ncbi:Z1 domain-containing protein [Xanthomonas sp. LF06-19]|uniref:Z1 domain-containing protein n=1 Tax=Xanthomonas sp. LF06-19 TaxID=3097551 RepID=UPI002A7F4653|nr:Z1 domain-containing protein [Xanthomonas sp. LF06-19]MDY4282680.1 Z1 domain-containing protein [Xanthomonas sp. LF06-19]
MASTGRFFDPTKFNKKQDSSSKQYERQLARLRKSGKEVTSIESAVRGAYNNLQSHSNSFVIYGEPQSGKTEMMICLTAKLLDEGYQLIIHLLNDSVDLLGQNLGRFKTSGLSPAAKNFSEVLDPAVKIKGQSHVIFCKKNGSDLRKLIDKIDGVKNPIVIDDEADYASPNGKINKGEKTKINELITNILGDEGIYIGVTATPARLDLNNTFSNDSHVWVDFPTHSRYTGQDVFFPESGPIKYQRTLLPDAGDDPKYVRQALFSFLVNAAHLNLHINHGEQNYSFLLHTSGKKIDHKGDWSRIHSAIEDLSDRTSQNFSKYAEAIWTLANERYPDFDPDEITTYVLENAPRHALVVLNSERDWKNNSGAATDPQSLFTIIIGGNIVSRGVTLNNLLSMFFTRDVKHKIQQDTYIQRARMFGSRGAYLEFFELTMPQSLYVDWHRCFMFHKLALSAIREGQGALVWIGDHRIAPAASASIDQSTVDIDRAEMAFDLFDFPESSSIEFGAGKDRMYALAALVGEKNLPSYLVRYIDRSTEGTPQAVYVHPPIDISGYADPDVVANVSRRRGFIGNPQLAKGGSAIHHLFVVHNGSKARIIYKFKGNISFIKNLAHDS